MTFPNMQKRIVIAIWALNIFSLVMCFWFINPMLQDIYIRISVDLIVMWFALMFSYYIWAIYFYNINLGYSDDEWKRMEAARDTALKKKDEGKPVADEELVLPEENPYKEKTFGLPDGTVRGTIALTILVLGTAMMLLQFNAIQAAMAETNSEKLGVYEKLVWINNDRLKLFGEAFLMMVAFYFGTKGLEILREKKG